MIYIMFIDFYISDWEKRKRGLKNPLNVENPDLFESGFSFILVSLSWSLSNSSAVEGVN
jgi:hypothetical protein